jgi:hypothetical protein
MKVWVLKTKSKHVGYDEYDAHVVVAETEGEARALCPWADEGGIWIDRELSSCEELVPSHAGVILSSFNAG